MRAHDFQMPYTYPPNPTHPTWTAAGDTRHQPVLSLENWLHVRASDQARWGWTAIPPSNVPNSPTHHPTYAQQRRGWSSPSSSASGAAGPEGESIPAGLRILSHLLSYPLTLAHYLSHICPCPPPSVSPSSSSSQGTALVMLGARAEATLPSLWWRELLCYHGSGHLNLSLHLVGPELPSSKGGGERVPLVLPQEQRGEGAQQQRQGQGQGGGELTLHRHRGVYHQLIEEGEGEYVRPSPVDIRRMWAPSA